MDAVSNLELFGYTASVIIAISLMMKDIVKLRWLNFAGCGMFVIYGMAISAWPVAAMNTSVCCINLYHLLKIYRAKHIEQQEAQL